AGKKVPKKDLALQAIAYGNVYVARVAMGADPQQTLRALREAEAYQGPSLVIAYSHCIAHGIEKDGMPLRNGMDQQYRAVATGYRREGGEQPMNLATRYLGLDLRNPLVASAGPMTQSADRIKRLAEAGVGAVVLPSLFEEQIRAEADRDERLAEVGTDSFGEA